MNEQTLVLFTDSFPYGKGETFLETEIRYFNRFREVIFVPVNATEQDKKRIRAIPLSHYRVIDIKRNRPRIQKISGWVAALLHGFVWEDVSRAARIKGFSGIKEAVGFDALASYLNEEVQEKIGRIDFRNTIIYAYWLHLAAYTALKFRGSSTARVVSRCHGYDLYEERNGGYLPFRNYMLRELHHIYCVSENGKEYLKERFPFTTGNVSVSRLGTVDYGTEAEESEKINREFTILSCSNVIRLKRIDRIIEVLAAWNPEDPVCWIHIGDGTELERIREKAIQKLAGSNVRFLLKGYVENESLINFYHDSYIHCFIHLSSTEGVPVSIMEAMSFGIPIIATDVGGTKEIVAHGQNGYLIRPDFTEEEVVEALREMIAAWKAGSEEYRKFRRKSREIWEETSSADNNYPAFIRSILSN